MHMAERKEGGWGKIYEGYDLTRKTGHRYVYHIIEHFSLETFFAVNQE